MFKFAWRTIYATGFNAEFNKPSCFKKFLTLIFQCVVGKTCDVCMCMHVLCVCIYVFLMYFLKCVWNPDDHFVAIYSSVTCLRSLRVPPPNLLIENHYTYLTGLLWGKNKHVKEFLVYTRHAVYEKWVLLKPFSGLQCSLDKIQIPCPGMWTGSTLFLPRTYWLLDWLILNFLQFPVYAMLSLCLCLPAAIFPPTHIPLHLGSYRLYDST